MDFGAIGGQYLSSLRSAIDMTILRKSMNQDAASVNNLVKSMDVNAKALQRAVQPHRGSNIDVTV